MKYQKIILAGGQGFMGKALVAHFKDIANEIVILSRKPHPPTGNITTLVWDGKTSGSWAAALEGADLLVNLCGKNVNCRYNAANKAAIISSRVNPTKLLGKVVEGLENPPKLWINIASSTIYRHAEDTSQNEATGDIGHGSSVEVCKRWEQTFFEAHTPGTRRIALRMAIVLGNEDGAFPRMVNLVKTGLGGQQGNGEQYISWIHEQDAAKCVEWLMTQPTLQGVVNCCTPDQVKNKEFMQLLRKAVGMPFGMPSPAWLLALGAVIIGTETELILKSRWVEPTVLLDNGFKFDYPTADAAINNLISTRK